VTNDDGVDSPALVPLLRALSDVRPVRAVVPDRERSWIGKAITRFDEIRVSKIERGGFEIHVAGGFPADCTQLGVHSLFGEKPDMVVSGVNIGLNNGLAFFLSSGTVGAAAEGWIAGIPAIAFSTGVTREHRPWAARVWDDQDDPVWERAAAIAADITRAVLESGYPDDVDLLNVNFREDATVESPRRVTDIAKVGYDNIFREASPGVFVHDFSTGLRLSGPVEGTDVGVILDGEVSITPVRLAHSTVLSAAERAALERG
jgi:5'-nucleotidase